MEPMRLVETGPFIQARLPTFPDDRLEHEILRFLNHAILTHIEIFEISIRES